MAQLFKPNANTHVTVSLIVGALIPIAVFYFGSTITRSSHNTQVGNPLDQPIPFSHKHHAFELGIDCRFCHTSVETGAVAGLPTTEICMTCHSQIWSNSPLLEPLREGWRTGTPIEWVKVNRVPDFVYFDHSIHVNKGISCNVCHGPVQEMQITAKGQTFHMAWCLDCHNSPQDFMFEMDGHEGDEPREPRKMIFDLYAKYINGEQLAPIEYEILEGRVNHLVKIPDDADHDGLQIMKDRKINASQLTDCYTCHR